MCCTTYDPHENRWNLSNSRRSFVVFVSISPLEQRSSTPLTTLSVSAFFFLCFHWLLLYFLCCYTIVSHCLIFFLTRQTCFGFCRHMKNIEFRITSASTREGFENPESDKSEWNLTLKKYLEKLTKWTDRILLKINSSEIKKNCENNSRIFLKLIPWLEHITRKEIKLIRNQGEFQKFLNLTLVRTLTQ